MHAPDDDRALIRRWFQRLQVHVQAVDYAGARPLFAEDLITFGTFSAFTLGREATEAEQWRNIWSRIDRFRWQLDELRAIISGDRLMAVGMATFESTGYSQDGTPYDRPGRSTVVLGRGVIGDEWVAQHVHVSLFRDVPTRSFGSRPEHSPTL